MHKEQISDHFGMWWAVVLWVVVYGLFLAFVPFYRKSQRKPACAYIAFIVAFALEMFGVPFSMFAIAGIYGSKLPDGIFWGHTLNQYIGLWGMYIGIVFFILGGLLVGIGWHRIHKLYWSKEEGKGELVTDGIYAYIRHPQYTGFLLITLGMICEWATLPMLIMWPVLMLVYYRLARREESDMDSEFGDAYKAYRSRTGMFFPKLKLAH